MWVADIWLRMFSETRTKDDMEMFYLHIIYYLRQDGVREYGLSCHNAYLEGWCTSKKILRHFEFMKNVKSVWYSLNIILVMLYVLSDKQTSLNWLKILWLRTFVWVLEVVSATKAWSLVLWGSLEWLLWWCATNRDLYFYEDSYRSVKIIL